MWLKYPIIALSFFLLALIQNSFLAHVSIFGITPNLVFILFFLLLFFESIGEYTVGIFSVVVAGFLLDVFLPFYFGANILSLLVVYVLFKITARFLKEMQGKYLFLYFTPIFLFFWVIYGGVFYLVTHFYHITFSLPPHIFIGLAYNLAAALLMGWAFKVFVIGSSESRQLKLF